MYTEGQLMLIFLVQRKHHRNSHCMLAHLRERHIFVALEDLSYTEGKSGHVYLSELRRNKGIESFKVILIVF